MHPLHAAHPLNVTPNFEQILWFQVDHPQEEWTKIEGGVEVIAVGLMVVTVEVVGEEV